MKRSVMLQALAVCFAAYAETETTEIHPDWAGLVSAALESGKSVQIPEGETWVAKDSDVEYIHLLPQYHRMYVNGTLVLDGVTQWNCRGEGSGTIVKRGESTLVITNGNHYFKGTFDIEEGTVDQQNYYLTSGSDSSARVYVRSGATYKISPRYGTGGSIDLGLVEVHVSGSGVDGAGALVVEKSGESLLSKLVVDDDARIVINQTGKVISSRDADPATARKVHRPATVNILAGKKLTIGGTAEVHGFYNTVFSGGGEVVFEAKTDGTARIIEISGTNDLYGTGKITLPAGAIVRANGSVVPQSAELSCAGAVVLESVGTAASLEWSGPVNFTGNEALILQPAASDHRITVSGAVSGESRIQVGTESLPATGTAYLAFPGLAEKNIALYGSGDCRVMFKTMPDFEKVAVSGCEMLPMPGPDENGDPRWTASQVLRFVSEYGADESPRGITIATEEIEDPSSLTIAPDDVTAVFESLNVVWKAYGASGAYTLSGPYSETAPLDISLTSGGIRLTGTDQIVLGDVLVGGTSATEGGTLILDGAGDVVFGSTGQTVTVGTTASGGTGFGRIVVTNSTLHSDWSDESEIGSGTLWIGRHSRGVMEIEAGSVVSSKTFVGGGGPAAHEGKGVGAVYQRGGTVRPVCKDLAYKSWAIGPSGAGFWQMEGGLFDSDSGIAIGAYDRGIFIQTGGEVELSEDTSFYVGAKNGGNGHYCVLGGHASGSSIDCIGGNASDSGFVTVEGAGSEIVLGKSVRTCSVAVRGTSPIDQRTAINLNRGGTIEATFFATKCDYTKYAGDHPLTVNFNGGTLRAKGSGEIFSNPESEVLRVSRVAVYENGITIDCSSDKRSVTVPIEAAGAGGIASITLSEPVTGCIAPNVEISGDGFAASAIACFDTRTCTVTNILVTGRGWGYTKENTTIKLLDGLTVVKTLTADEFTVADNATGGFTKKGAGTLSIGNTNGWSGTTSVLEGTLKILCEKAVPSGTLLTLDSGAKLDLNGCEASFSGLVGTGGTVANGTLKLVGTWTVDAERVTSGGAIATFDAEVDVSGLTLAVTDSTLLDHEVWRYPVFAVAEGRSITGTPATEIEGWCGEIKGRTFRLISTKPRGTVLIVR